MLTARINQQTLQTAFNKNQTFKTVVKRKINFTHVLYVGFLSLLFLLGSLPSQAQLAGLTLFNNNCHIDDWTALKALYQSTSGYYWNNYDDSWENIIAEPNQRPRNCNLNDLEGIVTNDQGRVRVVALPYNNLVGSIPEEFGLLVYLDHLRLSGNHLNGEIPTSLSNLNNLNKLLIDDNDLTGEIPTIQSVVWAKIQGNRFTCENIDQYLNSGNVPANLTYSPQYFAHDYEPFIADTNEVNNVVFNISLTNYNQNNRAAQQRIAYNWVKNGNDEFLIAEFAEGTAKLYLNNLQREDAGKYQLYIYNTCAEDLQMISDPIYVIYPGYDLYGQPAEMGQIMVEFDRPETTAQYEDDILYANAGWVVDQCNCNRELYLWQFPNTQDAIDALIEIDSKITIGSNNDGDVDGGLNNVVNIGQVGDVVRRKNSIILPMGYDQNRSDEASIFILDTGLDNDICRGAQHLYGNAPIDTCYMDSIVAAAYNYSSETGIDDNYQDNVGHGTYGFNMMAHGFQFADNIKIVPLKVFNDAGQGNLFDLTCAIYHAIDHGADVINISAGYYGQNSSILEKAIHTAMEQDVFICAAAGNEGFDIDTIPQYPASYAGLYRYTYNKEGEIIDSTRYSNVISVAAVQSDETLTEYSNVGSTSVTLGAYGHFMSGEGLDCSSEVQSGTSIATFILSRFLAMEIANDNSRSMEQVWNDFENTMLVEENSLTDHTITGKKLRIGLITMNGILFGGGKLRESGEDLQVAITHPSPGLSLLSYNAPSNGTMHITLFDANGRYVRDLTANHHVNEGKQQFELYKKALQPGIYFVHMQYQPVDGVEQYEVLKLPVLQ